MLSFTKYTHFGKNSFCKFFFVLSSLSFVPLERFDEYMCLTYITLNLSACQLFSYTFHWTKIKSLSWPFPAKSSFILISQLILFWKVTLHWTVWINNFLYSIISTMAFESWSIACSKLNFRNIACYILIYYLQIQKVLTLNTICFSVNLIHTQTQNIWKFILFMSALCCYC